MKGNKTKAKRRLLPTVLWAVFGGLILLIGALAYFSAQWYITVFGDTGFDSILSTLTAGVGGASGDLVAKFLLCALLPALIFSGLITVILFALPKRNLVANIGTKLKLILYPFPRILSFLLALLFSASLFYSGALRAGAVEYLKAVRQKSSVFEEYYVDPAAAEISFPQQKRNLIYIFLESMETSFFSQELGGGNDENLIPELYELADGNVNFSQNESVGGLFTLSGGTWTIGSMVSQTAGVPLKVPLRMDGNDYGQEEFLPGLTSLSDVLHGAGYYQALMVGSDATFGGRKQYYEQHGTDKIYDLYTARQDGIIPEDYYVWWGMEDSKLFGYAKQELIRIAVSDQPFAFTLLTADTHHVGGYLCENCPSDFPEQYENVLACSSRQVAEFVAWIQAQDFYENTTVVLCGDHLTMDSGYVLSNVAEGYQRKIYNCFINSAVEPIKEKNRLASTMDLFPTTLAALGCEIQGQRLGLGTNLFSDTPTLSEVLSPGGLNGELVKYSQYYSSKFYVK